MVPVRRHARDWRAYLACGGVVVGLLVAGSALTDQKGGNGDSHGPAREAAQKIPQATTATLNEPNDSQVYTRSCDQPVNDKHYELCVERQAMKATKKQALWAGLTFAVGVLGTAAVVATLAVNAAAVKAAQRSADAAEKAAKAALKQAKIAEKALHASERAWTSVEISDWGDFRFHKTGNADLFIKFLIKNFGKTPAVNVHTIAKMVENAPDMLIVGREFADERRKVDVKNSRLLLPQQSYTREYGVGTHESGGGRRGESFLPGIMVCVTYQTLPDLSIHQTLVCYQVSKTDDENGVPRGLLKVGESVIRDDLLVTITSGGMAY